MTVRQKQEHRAALRARRKREKRAALARHPDLQRKIRELRSRLPHVSPREATEALVNYAMKHGKLP